MYFGFQSTLPTRGSDVNFTATADVKKISIHAPHEGERLKCRKLTNYCTAISIHAPHEGERREMFLICIY